MHIISQKGSFPTFPIHPYKYVTYRIHIKNPGRLAGRHLAGRGLASGRLVGDFFGRYDNCPVTFLCVISIWP